MKPNFDQLEFNKKIQNITKTSHAEMQASIAPLGPSPPLLEKLP